MHIFANIARYACSVLNAARVSLQLPCWNVLLPYIYHAFLSLERTTLHLPCLPFPGRYYPALAMPAFPGRYFPAFTMPPFPWNVNPALTMPHFHYNIQPCIGHASLSLRGTSLHWLCPFPWKVLPCIYFASFP